MALEPLVTSTTYLKAGKGLEEGKPFLGHFQRSHEGEYGLTHYFVEQETKAPVGVNGTARLDGMIAKVDAGWLCSIEYKGKQKTKKGMNAHSFLVQVDKEDTFIEAPLENKEVNNGTDSATPSSSPQFSSDDIPL